MYESYLEFGSLPIINPPISSHFYLDEGHVARQKSNDQNKPHLSLLIYPPQPHLLSFNPNLFSFSLSLSVLFSDRSSISLLIHPSKSHLQCNTRMPSVICNIQSRTEQVVDFWDFYFLFLRYSTFKII